MASVSSGSKAVGPRGWGSLSAKGWRWFENVPTFAKHDEHGVSYVDDETRFADSRLAEAIRVFGQENVLTGNAWRDDGPFGIPDRVGIYVKGSER